MFERLGNKAKLKVLNKRELENYLLDEGAVREFVLEKQTASKVPNLTENPQAVKKVIEEEAAALKAEVVRLRIERKLLAPVFMHMRTSKGNIDERIKQAIASLQGRLDRLPAETAATESEISAVWNIRSLDLAPGTTILERVAKKYGVAFAKEKGDSERLASLLRADAIASELKDILREVASDEPHDRSD